MSPAMLVVTAVRLEGRSKAEVARDYGVSTRWVYELVRRFDAQGEAGLEPRSRRPHRSPDPEHGRRSRGDNVSPSGRLVVSSP